MCVIKYQALLAFVRAWFICERQETKASVAEGRPVYGSVQAQRVWEPKGVFPCTFTLGHCVPPAPVLSVWVVLLPEEGKQGGAVLSICRGC